MIKLFLHINAKKIETVISYFDNYLWNVGIQKLLLFGEIRESLNINDLSYEQQKVVYDLAMMLKQYNKENENGLR